jgi:hypothetical protein
MSWGAGRTSPGPRAHQRARYVLRRARPLKPATVLFEGDDPRAYIIASNLPVTPSWYGDSVGHYEGDTLVVGIKIGPFAMVDMYGESTASARAARGQQLTARNTGAPDAAKTDALRGRNTALENRPSASVPAPCSRGWAFT